MEQSDAGWRKSWFFSVFWSNENCTFFLCVAQSQQMGLMLPMLPPRNSLSKRMKFFH